MEILGILPTASLRSAVEAAFEEIDDCTLKVVRSVHHLPGPDSRPVASNPYAGIVVTKQLLTDTDEEPKLAHYINQCPVVAVCDTLTPRDIAQLAYSEIDEFIVLPTTSTEVRDLLRRCVKPTSAVAQRTVS